MTYPKIPRLGVNLDHVATLRNARGGSHPDPVRAALAVTDAGADGITVHLREDRRHIGDADLPRKPLVGLMWLTVARSHAPQTPADDWIRDLQEQAFSVAAEPERRQAVRLAQEWIAKNGQP